MTGRSSPSPAPPRMKDNEITICGLAAVRARFSGTHPLSCGSIFDQPRQGGSASSAARSPPRERSTAASSRPSSRRSPTPSTTAGSSPSSRRRPRGSPRRGRGRRGRRRENMVVLDRVGNAHNLGAIARTAAYLGVPRMVIAGDPAAARPGRRRVPGCGGRDGCRSRFSPFPMSRPSCGTSRRRASTSSAPRPGAARCRTGRGPPAPWALVLGNEEHGLDPAVESACTRLVTIPGSGRVESLNVSAAAAILIHGLGRREGGARRRVP